VSVTSDWFARFADEAHAESALYEAWARGVMVDDSVLDLLEELPRPKRQPVLIFAVSRLLGAPEADYPVWREWFVDNWDRVRGEALQRSTQTNEPRRAAALVPLLASITGPIALLEVGASAGLCLYPDRYSYLVNATPLDPAAGPSTVLIEVTTAGEPAAPMRWALPDIVWRGGVDLAPLGVHNSNDMHWLETLVWPEQHNRRDRILAAIDIARADPPYLTRGDAVADLAALVARAATAAPGATLVVVTAGVLVYLSVAERAAFVAAVREFDVRWISLEGPTVLPEVAALLPEGPAPAAAPFVLALDGVPVAYCAPHGHVLHWIADPQI
jgi:hypothetical protein